MKTLLSILFLFSTNAFAKPNVIIFLIDDLGWADLSCQGSRYYETPNLDKLAASG
ncbi:MAG: sulfatase-like hydrolase/transferase, partial [Akkermansiaceae bacterium]|nr:sulfatase-like hydrolase/transferase [Akkermansiaceae bacterium]